MELLFYKNHLSGSKTKLTPAISDGIFQPLRQERGVQVNSAPLLGN